MRGILKVGRDFFVYFDSKIGLVRRMGRDDAYKTIRLCGCMTVDALCDCVIIDALKLKKFIDSVYDFLEIPYEGDLDSDVIRGQDDLSKFTVADIDALFRTDDVCDDHDDLDDYANIDCCGDCDDCKDRDACDRLCDYNDEYDCCGNCDDCEVRDECECVNNCDDVDGCNDCDKCIVRGECDKENGRYEIDFNDDIPQSFDQTDTEILLTWEAEEYGDQEIEELEKDDSSPLWDEDNLLGGGRR